MGAEVHALDRFHAVAADRLAVLVEERQSDVPLADARCGIAVGAEHGRQREPPECNERRAADTLEDPAAIRQAEGHLARQQTVARRRANGGRAVGIGEAHPLARADRGWAWGQGGRSGWGERRECQQRAESSLQPLGQWVLAVLESCPTVASVSVFSQTAMRRATPPRTATTPVGRSRFQASGTGAFATNS